MKKILLFLLVLGALWFAVPWSKIGLPQIHAPVEDYKLGLDLHGGVELDYLVDFPADMDEIRRTQVIEDMKTILDGRVRRIGTTEPTLNTAQYGDETHIIVQIPTPSEFDSLSPTERTKRDTDFIQEAKEVIGQVIKIQFKEIRPQADFDTLLAARPAIVSEIQNKFSDSDLAFDSLAQLVSDSYENVFYLKNTELANLLGGTTTLAGLQTLVPDLDISGTQVITSVDSVTLGTGATATEGAGVLFVEALDGGEITTDTPLDARLVFIDREPLQWQPAKGTNGEILDERYLVNTVPSIQQNTVQYVVNLIFNTE